ncbi:MAG TPA: hypothetical protein VGP72_11515 [Planctomycetota bacterium]|jgi:hypothetical protein
MNPTISNQNGSTPPAPLERASPPNGSAGAAGGTPKRKWLRRLLIGAAVFVALLGITITALLLHYNDDWFKTQIQAAIKAQLGRDAEIGGVHVSFLGGSIAIDKLTLLNADAAFNEKHTLKIERATAKLSVLPALFSGFTKLRGVQVELDKPEFYIEKHGVWPITVSNIDDLVRKFSGGPPGNWPKQTGLSALDGTVAIHGGKWRYKDSDKYLGESRFDNLELTLKLDGLGQPVQLNTNFALITNATPNGGTTAIDGTLECIDAAGQIDPTAFKNALLSATLKNVDLPYILRHLHVEGELASGRYKWVPGQPLSGPLKLEAPTLSAARLAGTLETDGIIGLLEHHKTAAGSIPGRFEIDVQGGWSPAGIQTGAGKILITLASERAALAPPTAPKLLSLQVTLAPGSEGRQFSTLFKAQLAELCATDVGTALGLKDQLGGDVEGKVDAVLEKNGRFNANGRLNMARGFVAYQGVRQPSTLDLGFACGITPDSDGTPERAEMTFKATADSFQIHTLQPLIVNDIANPTKLAAQTKLQVHVGGRELWKQFGPLLQVMNMPTAIEETLDGQVEVTGNPGSLTLALDAELKRQSGAPAPVRLTTRCSYDGSAFVDEPKAPFLKFAAQIKDTAAAAGTEAGATTLNIDLNGSATQGKTRRVTELDSFKADGQLEALSALNARFGTYVRFFLGPEYMVKGTFSQSGQSRLVQDLAPDGKQAAQTMSMSTSLKLSGFSLSGPPVKEGAPKLAWADDNVALDLGMTLAQHDGTSTLTIKPVKLTSTLMSVSGEMAEADLTKLNAAISTPASSVKTWLEALPQAKLEASISAKALQQLQQMQVLPIETVFLGDVKVSSAYDPKSNLAKIESLSLSGPALDVKLSTRDIKLPALLECLTAPSFSLAKFVQALPTCSAELNAKDPVVLQTLQKRKILPDDPYYAGTLRAAGSYDSDTGLLALNSCSCTNTFGTVAFNAPSAALAKIAALLSDGQPLTAAKAVNALPNAVFSAQLAAPAAKLALEKAALKLPLQDAALTLSGSFDAATHLLKLDNCQLGSAALTATVASPGLDVARVAQFLDLPAPQRTLAALGNALPELAVNVQAKAALVEAVAGMLPADSLKMKLAGEVSLAAKYLAANDQFNLESLRFARGEGSNAPVAALEASCSATSFRALLGKLSGPPEAMLAHLAGGMTIKTLTITPPELFGWMKRANVASSFASDALAGVYTFSRPIEMRDLVLRPAKAPGTYDITFALGTQAAWRPAGEQAGTTCEGELQFANAAPLHIDTNPGQFSATGVLVTDAAAINAPKFNYSKAAGVPSKLTFAVSVGADGVLHASQIDLAGGPMGFALADLTYFTLAPAPKLTLGKAELRKGSPLEGTISDLQFDQGADSLRFQLAMGKFDLLTVAKLLMPPAYKLSGTLNDMRLEYAGRLSSLTQGLPAGNAGAADKIGLACSKYDVRLEAPTPDATAVIVLQGETLAGDMSKLTSKTCQLMISHQPKDQPEVAQSFDLQVSVTPAGTEAGTTLLAAAQKPGMPLALEIPIQCHAALNLTALLAAIDTFGKAGAQPGTQTGAPSKGLAAIAQLRLKGSFSAPVITLDQLDLEKVNVPAFSLNALKLTVIGATAAMYKDGNASLKKLEYDLATKTHAAEFDLANIDLHEALPQPEGKKKKDEYEFRGRLNGSGSLSGVGFELADRKTWDGRLGGTITGLVLLKNDGKPSADITKSITKVGIGFLGDFAAKKGGIGQDFNTMTDLYNDDFGLFLNKLEFEDIRLSLPIAKGIAQIEKTSIVGKGKSAGLQIDAAGGLNLPRESFAPDLRIWLIKLPPKTQESLRLNQLDPQERDPILAKFAQGKFQDVVLTGQWDQPKRNDGQLLKAFTSLRGEIDDGIKAKKAREAPPKPATQPPPAKK